MRTNELRKLIEAQLSALKTAYGITEVYYKQANDTALYPHVVYSMLGTTLPDFNRRDYVIDVDIYTKDNAAAFDIADAVEDLFLINNLPQTGILPTFYLEHRNNVIDEDKSISHVVVQFVTHLYDNE